MEEVGNVKNMYRKTILNGFQEKMLLKADFSVKNSKKC